MWNSVNLPIFACFSSHTYKLTKLRRACPPSLTQASMLPVSRLPLLPCSPAHAELLHTCTRLLSSASATLTRGPIPSPSSSHDGSGVHTNSRVPPPHVTSSSTTQPSSGRHRQPSASAQHPGMLPSSNWPPILSTHTSVSGPEASTFVRHFKTAKQADRRSGEAG